MVFGLSSPVSWTKAIVCRIKEQTQYTLMPWKYQSSSRCVYFWNFQFCA